MSEKVESRAYDNKRGFDYVSDEVYELIEDVCCVGKQGERFRLISNHPTSEEIGFHDYAPSTYFIVSPDGAEVGQYIGVAKDKIRQVV